MLEAEFVFLSVLGVYVSPVARQVPREVIKERFARYLQSCEGTGRRHHLTRIEPVHLTPTEAMCFS